VQLKTLALILLLCAPAVYAAEAAVSEGQVAPSFEVALADGQAADLATISKTRPTVVLFWASWCPYCKALMPHLQSLLDEYGSEKLEIIAVSIREDAPEDAENYLMSQGYDFLRVLEGDPVAQAWGVRGTPHFFLVGTDGRIVFDQSAHQISPKRRFGGKEIKGHSDRAARAAPAWAADLRRAIDQQP